MHSRHQLAHQQAQTLFRQNRLPEALAAFRQICEMDAMDIQAWHMCGAIAGMLGELQLAESCCRQVVKLAPSNPAGHINLANVLASTGRGTEAARHYKRALKLQPGNPQALNGLANIEMNGGDTRKARLHLQQALKSGEYRADTLNSLGNLERIEGRLIQAETCFRQALEERPGFTEARCNLAATLSDELRYEEAEIAYKTALEKDPGDTAALCGLANLLQSTGEFDAARSYYEKALALNPRHIAAATGLATLQERCGDDAKAVELLEPLVENEQHPTDALLVYARILARRGEHEAAISHLRNELAKPIPPDKQIDLHFALGECLDGIAEYDEAFGHFRKGNELDIRYRGHTQAMTDLSAMASLYNEQHARQMQRSDNRSELPVFIVGMPRSGTSLVEQILASHPCVAAGGERDGIMSIIALHASRNESGVPVPRTLLEADTQTLNEIANQHIDEISRLAGGCARFTDKTPLQGLYLGFINQLLPASRVIVCRRNPVDTCLSIYFHRFNAYHAYAADLGSLGRFHKSYSALLDHWSKTLDLKILNVQYERLVQNPEHEIRRLLEFCGLEWDKRCLDFHRNRRVVNTPSYNQVRKPIYTGSIDRWKNYAAHLDPLLAEIDDRA